MIIRFFKGQVCRKYRGNPNWREATTGVFSDNYCKAMKVKIATLEFMGAWEIVD